METEGLGGQTVEGREAEHEYSTIHYDIMAWFDF